MRPSSHIQFLLVIVCLLATFRLESMSAVFIDDASVDQSSLYTQSALANNGALTHNLATGGYDVTISGANVNSAWKYNVDEFLSNGEGISVKFWHEIQDTTVTTEERIYTYLTWGKDPVNPTVSDPASAYAEGYTLRVQGRENFSGNVLRLSEKDSGNAGGGLYREPGGLVTQLDAQTLGQMNPGVYFRTEWVITQDGGVNQFDYYVYQGVTAEFTDTDTLKASGTYTVAANVIDSGFLGFGFRRENSDAGSEAVATIHRIEFVGEIVGVPEASAGTLILFGVFLIRVFRKVLSESASYRTRTKTFLSA